MEPTALTSALKQVYNIHKNIVSDLNAKIDLLILENKNLKGNNLKEECLNCVQLKAKMQELQDNFALLIKEKESVIDQLRAQILSNHNDSALLADGTDDGCKYSGGHGSPSTDDSRNDSTSKDESREIKHCSKLRLIRENKRRNRYQEEVPEMKRKKTVQDRVFSRVLVTETEKLESQENRSMLNAADGEDSGGPSSQKILVVSETVDVNEFMEVGDALSAKNLALEEPRRATADLLPLNSTLYKPSIDVSHSVIDKVKTGTDTTFAVPDQASFHKGLVDSSSKKLKCQRDENGRANFLKAGDSNTGICKKEHSILLNSDGKTKCSEKMSSLPENLCERSQVFPGHTNKHKSCNVVDKRSVENNDPCLPLTIHSDNKGSWLQVNREKKGTIAIDDEKCHAPVLGTCDLNGSLNPDVRLSEFLFSQSTENLCLERNKSRRTSASLDETVAPDIVLQLHCTKSSLNSKGNKSPGDSQLTSSQSDTDSIKTVVNMFSAQQDGKHYHGLAGATPCLPINVQSVKDWESSEDDDEVVASSPLHTRQVSSQLCHSIPSSYKFMPKNKHVQHALDVRTDRLGKENQEGANKKDKNTVCVGEKAYYVDVEIKDDTADEFLDMDGALEEIEKNTVDEALDTAQSRVNPVNEEPSLMDSFDRVPQQCLQEVPHIQVVRKKSEKKKLEGYSCQECYQYYKNSGLTDEAMKQKMNECSRHRAKYLPASTPDHFWTIGFPETSDGLESPTHRQSLASPISERNPRRRRRLEKRFRSRNEEETQK